MRAETRGGSHPVSESPVLGLRSPGAEIGVGRNRWEIRVHVRGRFLLASSFSRHSLRFLSLVSISKPKPEDSRPQPHRDKFLYSKTTASALSVRRRLAARKRPRGKLVHRRSP